MDRSFLYITCQVGAEGAIKREVPHDFRLAYSRPGFLTFKLPAAHTLADDFPLRSVFARAYGFSFGKIKGNDNESLGRQLWELVGDRQFDQVHVWQRDASEPGFHGFQPDISPAAAEAAKSVAATAPRPETACNVPARPGELVLDCVIVDPDEWWIGYHRARLPASCMPGGFWTIELPEDAVSRAYVKMEEALRWSQLPIKPGERIVEIGSAPGGASQALLNRGLLVTGIDPAEMDPRIVEHANFVHVRKRGHEVRRREFRKMRWLAADLNVAPAYTLDTVEAIVTHPEVHVRGMLLTLKLPEWDLAAEIPAWLKRVRAWGYPEVHARQLAHNRQEICVAAIRTPGRIANTSRSGRIRVRRVR